MLARRALGRVEQLREEPQGKQQGYDVASVLLDVPADLVSPNISRDGAREPCVRIVAVDDQRRFRSRPKRRPHGHLAVSPLGEQVSQLLIAGNVVAGEQSATSHVVATVLRVCRELHKQCSTAG